MKKKQYLWRALQLGGCLLEAREVAVVVELKTIPESDSTSSFFLWMRPHLVPTAKYVCLFFSGLVFKVQNRIGLSKRSCKTRPCRQMKQGFKLCTNKKVTVRSWNVFSLAALSNSMTQNWMAFPLQILSSIYVYTVQSACLAKYDVHMCVCVCVG